LLSKVRRWADLERPFPGSVRFGIRRHYKVVPWSRFVEVSWGEGVEAYLTPVGPERLGVSFLWSDGKARFDALLSRFPRLQARLEGAEFESSARGAGPLRQGVRSVCRGQIALVGDASGYVDAITGEGLSLAFHQAEALVRCAVAGRLKAYPAQHRQITRGYRLATGLLLAVSQRPWLRRRALYALGREPRVFQYLLGFNDGVYRPPLSLLPALPRSLYYLLRGPG
jgi:flavin-dependent dehydrogenase